MSTKSFYDVVHLVVEKTSDTLSWLGIYISIQYIEKYSPKLILGADSGVGVLLQPCVKIRFLIILGVVYCNLCCEVNARSVRSTGRRTEP